MENKDYLNNISKDDFVLVQNNEKIFDVALSTKPTTFIKDAFRRFCKNKSSVVATYIIGLILLVTFLFPIFNPHDIKSVHSSETLLRPKLFEAGTGFWDGTIEIKGVAYDVNTKLPLDIKNPNSVSNLVHYVDEDGVALCDYTYDIYQEKYGEFVKIVPKVTINQYIEKGWCEFDFVNANSFKRLSDSCPIMEIVKVETDDGGTVRFTANVSLYRELGYDSMPKFIFGTNDVGKDIVKLAFVGLQKSLAFSIVISTICFLFGLVWGAISGYFGGNVDLFMERFKDVFGGVPTVIIVTLFRLHLGDALWVFATALCMTGWMGISGRTRTQFYRFKGREYVLASRTLGASDKRLIFRHILPNALGTIVTSAVLMIPGIIFTESSLSYLGLGLQGSDSFGRILSENQGKLGVYPALVLFPSSVVALLMISFNLFGNGLRDALNPSLKGSE